MFANICPDPYLPAIQLSLHVCNTKRPNCCITLMGEFTSPSSRLDRWCRGSEDRHLRNYKHEELNGLTEDCVNGSYKGIHQIAQIALQLTGVRGLVLVNDMLDPEICSAVGKVVQFPE